MRENLATLVDDFRLHAAETAVVGHRGNRRYATSYGELASLAGRFSAELERRGVAPGERVVLWGENSAEWIGVFFGCLLRGATAVPLDAAGAPEFAARVVKDVSPKLIVGDAKLLATLANHAPCLPLAEIAEHLPPDPLFTISEAVGPQTPFQIVFTSGTTAEPRGIVHTHRNILVTLGPIESEIAKYRKYERIFHPLRFLHSLPLSHVFGQFMGLWCPALLAAEVHFADNLEPARITALIRRERVSVLIAVPRVLHLLRAHLLTRFPALAAQLEQPAQNGRSGVLAIFEKWWRYRRIHSALGWKFWAVISGGATLPAQLEAFWNRVGYALIQGYGMTETAALVTLNHPFHIKQGTIGKPMPGREVKLTGEGEILVRGEMVTRATWQGGTIRQRESEWLATGDLAERSAEGELRFLGRKGDVIVTSAGLNIHPGDLEVALMQQPGIRAAAIVPCDLAAGPEPVAVVIASLSDAELDAAVAEANRALAEFQQIRRVLRWPELQFPFTTTGKLLRRKLAEWACARVSAQRAATETAQDALLSVIAQVTSEPAPAADDPNQLRLSEDLHLDSLGRVQLQSALEQRFSVDIEDDALSPLATVGDLRTLVEENVDRSSFSVDRSRTRVAQQAPEGDEQRTTGNVQRAANGAHALATPEQHLYPRWPWSRPIQALRTLWIELGMRPLVWLLAAPRVSYRAPQLQSSSLQSATPLLIVCNHITLYDGAFVLYALPRRLRDHVAAAMSGEMLLDFRRARNQPNSLANLLAPAAYWLVTALFNVFPLPRARGFRRSFAHAGEAMDRGYSVLIFPEGTRSRTGGMNPLRPGIGLLAQQSRVPILPVALIGLYGAKPRRWFHSGAIEVRVGEIIPAPSETTDPATLTAQLEQALSDLLSNS